MKACVFLLSFTLLFSANAHSRPLVEALTQLLRSSNHIRYFLRETIHGQALGMMTIGRPAISGEDFATLSRTLVAENRNFAQALYQDLNRLHRGIEGRDLAPDLQRTETFLEVGRQFTRMEMAKRYGRFFTASDEAVMAFGVSEDRFSVWMRRFLSADAPRTSAPRFEAAPAVTPTQSLRTSSPLIVTLENERYARAFIERLVAFPFFSEPGNVVTRFSAWKLSEDVFGTPLVGRFEDAKLGTLQIFIWRNGDVSLHHTPLTPAQRGAFIDTFALAHSRMLGTPNGGRARVQLSTIDAATGGPHSREFIISGLREEVGGFAFIEDFLGGF